MTAARRDASGFRFAGPQFYVFDEDAREARAWATELAALTPGPHALGKQARRVRRSTHESRQDLRGRH